MFKRKRTRPLLVSILGAGPAGLFAAQAAYDTGNVVQIFARGERSKLYGAQYLHAPVPGLDCGTPRTVNYILNGTAEGYRRKVYGDGFRLPVSPEVLNSKHPAWDIRSAYDQAWERFNGLIREQEITHRSFGPLAAGVSDSDLVVWSIPLAPLCVGAHGFNSQSIWAQGDAPELGLYCSVGTPYSTVIVNGEDAPSWYRASNVFGYKTAEWPDGTRPPIEGVVKVNKPVATNCDCWQTFNKVPVLRVGRYGTWTKGELSHMAYVKTRYALETM